MHFVYTFRFLDAEDERLMVTEKVRNYGKIVFTNCLVENGWLGMTHPLHFSSGFTPDNDHYCQLKKRTFFL